MKIINSESEFEAELVSAGDKAILIDFYADWCGPCKIIAPKLEAMANETPSMVFFKVNVDEAEELAAKYKIEAMPTFLVIKNKQQVDKLMGANEAKLRELVAKHK